MWNHTKSTPPSRSSVLTSTPPRVYPLRGRVSSLAYAPVSGSDTICNSWSPSPLLVDIVLLGFLFRASPQSFKTRMLEEGFHTLIKGVPFSSQPMWNSHVMVNYFLKSQFLVDLKFNEGMKVRKKGWLVGWLCIKKRIKRVKTSGQR